MMVGVTKSMSLISRADSGLAVGGIDNEGGLLRGVVSTSEPDRRGDIVETGGWELEAFRRNPVLLWMHDRSSPPIGKVERIGIEGDGLVAYMRFMDAGLGGLVRSLYQRGYLNAFSVSFLPLQYRRRGVNAQGMTTYRYTRQELLEVSAVTVPIDAQALRRSWALDDFADLDELDVLLGLTYLL